MISDPDPDHSRHAPLFFFLLLLLLPFAAAQSTTTGPDDPYRYARFSPSMAIIVVILIAALFFMAFFSIYIRRCNTGTGTVLPIAAGGISRRATAAARGLDSAVIDKFPIFAYSAVKDLKIGKGALECAVCLSEFDEVETLRLIPKCDHVFHSDCIDAWLASHTTCPVCRADLAPDNSADHVGPQQDPAVDSENHVEDPPAVVVNVTEGTNRSSRRGSKFPRSHSTGHSLVQPGEDTEKYTLRLPVEVRKQIMANRMLNRATSMVVLPREGSSRRGYRRLESFGRPTKSDRWVFTMAPPFLVRESSFKMPKSENQDASELAKPPSFFTRAFSFKVQKAAAREEGTSASNEKLQSTDSPLPV